MSFSNTTQTTISPHNQQPLVTRDYPTSNTEIDAVIVAAARQQKEWAAKPLSERIAIGERFIVSASNP